MLRARGPSCDRLHTHQLSQGTAYIWLLTGIMALTKLWLGIGLASQVFFSLVSTSTCLTMTTTFLGSHVLPSDLNFTSCPDPDHWESYTHSPNDLGLNLQKLGSLRVPDSLRSPRVPYLSSMESTFSWMRSELMFPSLTSLRPVSTTALIFSSLASMVVMKSSCFLIAASAPSKVVGISVWAKTYSFFQEREPKSQQDEKLWNTTRFQNNKSTLP